MAVEKQLDDENGNSSTKDSAAPLGGDATPLSDGAGAGSGGGQTSAGSPSSSGATPSGHPNIQQYLDANQGAGDSLSQGIQQRYGQDADQFNTGVQTTKSQFDSAANPLQSSLGDSAENQIQTSFKDPNAILNNSDSLSNYQKLQSGGYGTDAKNLGTQYQTQENGLQNQLDTLGQTANLANSETGRFQLLNQTYGQPNYSTGQQRLDQLFLQAQPGATKGLSSGLANQNQQAVQGYNTADADAQAKLQALEALSGQRSDEINTGLASNMSDVQKSVQSQYDDLAKNAGNYDPTAMQNAFTSNQFTPEQMKALGMVQGTQTWGLGGQDLMNAGHYTYNPLAAADQGGLAQAATSDQFNRYNALMQLAGNNQQNIFGGAQSAGGYNPVNFDATAAQNAINARQKTLSTSDLQNAINAEGGYAADNEGLAPMMTNMDNELQAGHLSPEQAQQEMTNWKNQFITASNAGGAQWNNGWNADKQAQYLMTPLEKYFQDYGAASSSQFGNNNTMPAALPTDPNTGNVDWSKIGVKPPMGK